MKLSVQEEKFVRQLLSTREIPYPKLPIKDHTTPEENKILGAFTERKFVPLEGVPTYEYMTNMNLCLNSCSSAVNCTLGCGTLGYMVLTAHPAVFSTHCDTAILPPTNLVIQPVMPNSAPTVAIFSEFIRTHKHEVCLFKEYHAADRACEKVISQLNL